jgi:hypothetical protein
MQRFPFSRPSPRLGKKKYKEAKGKGKRKKKKVGRSPFQ